MRPEELNYRHLLYFWAVAKEGSVTRAAERLNLSVQTISTQLGLLERQLGRALLVPKGRSLALTEEGRIAMGYAEQIFQLGDRLRRSLKDHQETRIRLAVGLTDAVPKLVAFHLLVETLQEPVCTRIECSEGDFDGLLSELALNRLDVVIADRSAPQLAHRKLHSHLLGTVPVALFGSAALHAAYGEDFPRRLDGAPVLLPARGDPLRGVLDTWFEHHDLRPQVIGEFSDSALLKTFGRAGVGLFPGPAILRTDIRAQYEALPLGVLEGVRESWYVIAPARRIEHPAVAQIIEQGSARLLGQVAASADAGAD